MSDLHDKKTAIAFYEHRYEEGYMEEWDDLKKAKVVEVISSIGLPPKGKALDFGCGNGVFTGILKQALPGWEIYGVEISTTAVQNASKAFPACHFFVADESHGYAGQFDFLFSHHVIEHVQDLRETFDIINGYLKPVAAQLHILPCRNQGSYEYKIASLRKNGIEKDKENRFFFEEEGHLRRLSSAEFAEYEKSIGFDLVKEFYSNQEAGAINWITKSSPSFVKKLTDPAKAIDAAAAGKLRALRKKLLPMTYRQFAYSKYWDLKTKWNKSAKDWLKLFAFFIPAMLSKAFYTDLQKQAAAEWEQHKTDRNGSEMFLFFQRG